ncbi:hypothetical protein [Sphingomonas pokkalii]|uniref:DUF4189 domain-containing protein n=1 Tax=Sphingomonas pokkalii TaxID=2175090 RepID=A0A2U0SAT3_9SPHN|nr:hypothetical protein [Sphingomonas pokkalii]PVX28488.1 hypothetical protein DD559_03330 [Sphingomonas pokkalii]
MLKTIAFITAAVAAPLLLPGAAQAQNAVQNGVLIIYGNDKCPTNKNGEEIVVCQRLDEGERFRIPKTIRDTTPTSPQKGESWAVRSQDALTAGNFGTGSCSTVGAGGGTGCFVQRATAARAERRAQKKAETDLPLP